MARPPVPLFGSKPAVPKFQAPPRNHLVDDNDEDLHQSLKIVGQSASLCEDDKTAAWLESQQHLQLWMGDKEEDLWIDRYDVRLLLSDASLFARRGQASAAAVDDPEEKMLDAERYSDLPPEGEEAAPPQEYDGEAEEVDGPNRTNPSNQFGAVHFSFGGQGASQPAQQQAIPPEIVAFATGWLTELAPGSALPQTFKQHQVIERTAKFVHKQGKKMEAMLKVKHGGNAAFQFLLVDHPLQAYYQALLKYLGYCPEAADLPTLLPTVEQPAEVASEAAEAPAEKAPPAGGAHAAEQDSAAMPEAGADAPAASVASAAVASAASAEQADQMLSKAIADAKQKLDKERERAACAEEGAPASAGNGEPARSGELKEGDGIHQQIPIPPDEMLQTIEKLVRWILKSGRDFEKKVKERQRGDPRFEFLMPWNPYNAFYRQRLDDAFNGKLEEQAGDTASAGSGAAVPPWRTNSYATPVSAESAETGATNVPARADGAGAGAQSVAQENAAAHVKPTDEENPKVQFITSFGDDSEEEKTEEKRESTANSSAEQGNVTAEQATETAEAAPKKERNSRFGPDLSETEKKAARLARAKQLSLLVKDKVEAVKTAEEADSKGKDKEHKSSKESKRSRKSRSRSRSPKSRSSRRSSSRSRSRSRSSRRRRSRSRDRHGKKHSKRDRSNSRERKRRRSSRSRSNDRSRSHSHDRHRDRSRSDRGKSRHKDRDRSPKQKSRRRSRSPHHRRRRSSSKSRSRSRSRSRASNTTSLKQPTAGTSSSPPRPDAREDVVATDAAAGIEGSTVSAELRDKVKAMLGQIVS